MNFVKLIEENPVKVLATYTLLVVATTWGIYRFVFTDNRVALADARTSAATATAEQYKAKLDITQQEIETLRAEHKEYVAWLAATPDSVNVVVPRLVALRKRVSELESRAAAATEPDLHHAQLSYKEATLSARPGTTAIDKVTGLSVAVHAVKVDRTADILINFPSGKAVEQKGAKAGQVWSFEFDGKGLNLQIAEIEFISDTVTFTIAEQYAGKSGKR